MKLLELSKRVVRNAYLKRQSDAVFHAKQYGKYKSPYDRDASMHALGKIAASRKNYEKRIPKLVSFIKKRRHTIESQSTRRLRFLREADRTRRHVANLKETSFYPSDDFPLHPEDRRKNVDQDFGLNRSTSSFSHDRYPSNYAYQPTVPLNNYKKPGLSGLEKAALAFTGGMAVAGLGTAAAGMGAVGSYLGSGAARGIYRHYSIGKNARNGINVLSDRASKGQPVTKFYRNLFTGERSTTGHTGDQLRRILKSRKIGRTSYGKAAWRGVKNSILHPVEHVKAISGWNWLTR